MRFQICWESFKELVLSEECPIEGAGWFCQRWIGIPVSIIKVCTYKCTDRCLVSNNDTFHLPLSYDLYMCISNISKKLPNSIIWHRCYTLLQLVYNGLLSRKVRSAYSPTMNIWGNFLHVGENPKNWWNAEFLAPRVKGPLKFISRAQNFLL